MDTTEIQPSAADAQTTGVDRRTLIKRAAAAGAVAWAAPIIIDSVTSPAGALTCTGACFRFQFQENSTCASLPGVTFGSNMSGATCTATFDSSGTGTTCTTLTTINSGHTLANTCLSVTTGSNCNSDNTLVFTLSQAAGCFTAGGATPCNAPRRILKARRRLGDGTCATSPAASVVINATGTTVTFTKGGGTSWSQFQFLIGCSCS